MRILAFFLNGCECGKFVGGAERRFFKISQHLSNFGVQIAALEYESLHSERCSELGYSPIRTKRRFPHNAILNSLTVAVFGSILCLKSKCDIVYVTEIGPWKDTFWTALVAPYIVSCVCRKPLAIIFHHLDGEDVRWNLFKFMAIKKATCMAVSKATADDVRKNFQVKDVSIVGNGIDVQNFDVPSCKIKKYDAVFHGRIAEDKGIFELLQAWRDVVAKMPSAQLLLIGGIDNTIRIEILRVIKKFNLEKRVHFSGFVSDKELAMLLRSSKIHVLPSHREGFGLAVVEAMASDLPCVVSDLPALREVFSSAAIFVQPRNVDSLTDAILLLLSSPEKRSHLQEKGKSLVNRFSWKEVARKEFEVLKRVSG